jgi:pimeloyl-ACP methyl ester carboxylesterase
LALLCEALLTWRDRRRYLPPGRLVDVGGHRLHLHCMGEGTPAVVFECGAGSEGSDWMFVQPEVARHTRACAYDRAGMGWSDEGPRARTAESYASELRTLLERDEVPGPYVLVAHSLGGLYTLEFASRYPELVAGMVFVDAGYKAAYETLFGRRPEVAKRIRRQLRLVRVGSLLCRLGVVRLLFARRLGRKLPEDVRRAQASHLQPRMIRALATEGRTTFGLTLAGARCVPPDVPAAVLSHSEPAMRIRGEDPVEVEESWQQLQRDLAAMFTHGTYEVVDGSGHYIQHDRPDAVVAAILRVVEAARAARALS